MVFGAWLRNTFASSSNPQRDGMYVETVRKAGGVNAGTHYRLTDGKGEFWLCRPEALVPMPKADDV